MPKPKVQAESAPIEAKPALTVVETDEVVAREAVDDALLGEMTDGLPSETSPADAPDDIDMTPIADVTSEVAEKPAKPNAKPSTKSNSEPKPEPEREVDWRGVTPTSMAPTMTPEEEARHNDTKVSVFNTLIESVDLTELAKMPAATVREEIGDVVSEIVSMKALVLSAAEQQHLIEDICNDILGLGPLEPLIARDDIADIMVNGPNKIYIEVDGKIELTPIRFRDNAQLMNICQRIVSAVGRRVDEASPICDARLLDGSRVNVIAPPLAIDGAALTIRKFKRDRLTLDNLVDFDSISPAGANIIKLIGHCRINTLVSGGTGSGKTTLLNCLTRYIAGDERIITCEDAAELQLQQPHVVRLETRPPNLEGIGEVTMTDLVKNCLRMRPERIIVGEVRGKEAFDLLQAMNTGHDGSMGTIHANNPRECLSRIENMIAMSGYSLPAKTVREQIAGSVNVIIQATRLRDGSRKITHITEVIGMEGDVITLQDIIVFDFEGETNDGRIVGRHKYTGLRPNFYDRVRYFGKEQELVEALQELAVE